MNRISQSLIVFTLALTICIGCKTNPYKEAQTAYAGTTSSVDSCTIELPADTQKTAYKIFSSTHDGLFCGFNDRQHTISIYSLREKKLIRKFTLLRSIDKAKPYPIIFGLFMRSMDSIFVFSKAAITLYSGEGKVVKTIPINEYSRSNYFRDNYLIDYEESLSLSFDPKAGRLFIPTVDPTKGAKDPAHFSKGFVTEYQMQLDNSFSLMPVGWCPLYLNGYYGFMNNPQFGFESVKGHRSLVYNFEIEPNIYVYDMEAKKIATYGARPEKHPSFQYIATPIDKSLALQDDKKILQLMENVRYYKVQKFPGGYIRPYEEPTSFQRKSNGKFSNFEDKKRFITIMNNDFEVVANVGLNDRWYLIGRAFTTDDGVYIPYSLKGILRFKFLKLNNK